MIVFHREDSRTYEFLLKVIKLKSKEPNDKCEFCGYQMGFHELLTQKEIETLRAADWPIDICEKSYDMEITWMIGAENTNHEVFDYFCLVGMRPYAVEDPCSEEYLESLEP